MNGRSLYACIVLTGVGFLALVSFETTDPRAAVYFTGAFVIFALSRGPKA